MEKVRKKIEITKRLLQEKKAALSNSLLTPDPTSALTFLQAASYQLDSASHTLLPVSQTLALIASLPKVSITRKKSFHGTRQ